MAQQEQRQHRRVVAWQVVVAAIVGLGLVVGLVALVLLRSGDEEAAPAHPATSVTLGCASCHSTDGARAEGPTWAGLAGSEVQLSDGTTVLADEAYLRRAITEPGAQVRTGFVASMPTVEVSPEELDALVAFITSLGDEG